MRSKCNYPRSEMSVAIESANRVRVIVDTGAHKCAHLLCHAETIIPFALEIDNVIYMPRDATEFRVRPSQSSYRPPATPSEIKACELWWSDIMLFAGLSPEVIWALPRIIWVASESVADGA